MKNAPQVSEEVVQGGYTHRFDLSWRDLFGVTIGASTAKTFNLAQVSAGDQFVKAHLHLTTAFKDASDAAFNDVQFSFGDEDNNDVYIDGIQINENGTEVIDTFQDEDAAAFYTALKQLTVTIDTTSGKDLTNIDTGKLYLEYTILRHGSAGNPLKNPLD